MEKRMATKWQRHTGNKWESGIAKVRVVVARENDPSVGPRYVKKSDRMGQEIRARRRGTNIKRFKYNRRNSARAKRFNTCVDVMSKKDCDHVQRRAPMQVDDSDDYLREKERNGNDQKGCQATRANYLPRPMPSVLAMPIEDHHQFGD